MDTTNEATPAVDARTRLKEIAAAKAATRDEEAMLRASLNEGKETRKAQRAAGALCKKLFKDRRAVVLVELPKALHAASRNGNSDELARVIDELEGAFDSIVEILSHQLLMATDSEHVPDLVGLELPDEPRKARVRKTADTPPATPPAPLPAAKKKKGKKKKSKKAPK